MNWIILSPDGKTISNIIVAEEEFAQSIGCKPYYDGASIGEVYAPPRVLTEAEKREAMYLEIIADQEYRLSKIELGLK